MVHHHPGSRYKRNANGCSQLYQYEFPKYAHEFNVSRVSYHCLLPCFGHWYVSRLITFDLTVPDKKRKARREQKEKIAADGEFLYFPLMKQGKDTMEAIGILSKCTGVPRARFSTAGTKDKRSISVQLVSGYGITNLNLEKANAMLRGMKVGPGEHKKDQVRLGDLSGNQFGIILRDIEPCSSQDLTDLQQRVEAVKQDGFLNFYGKQRFGSHSISTDEIGCKILKGDWEGAVSLIMTPHDTDRQEFRFAKDLYAEGKIEEALRAIPRFSTCEKAILEFFKVEKNRTDFLGALSCLPRNMRLMYVRAYQSRIWNEMVCKRIEMGRDVMEGDLVSFSDCSVDVEDEDVGKETSRRDQQVVVVTKELLEAWKSEEKVVGLEHVVLPLPGYEITYPPNLVTHYEELMRIDTIDPHDMKRSQKEFSLGGAYRHIITKVNEIDMKILKDVGKDFLDMNGVIEGTEEVPIENVAQGDNFAVYLQFKLGTSSYATMFLRELLGQHPVEN